MKLVHCSYHKCLTVYYSNVMSSIYNRFYKFSKGYKHFNSLVDEFYRETDQYRVSSVNNHAIDLAVLGDAFRLTRFIRDPRDLIVSGYFYHKRGAETWCDVIDPTPEDWRVVNGNIPEGLRPGDSYSSYLQSLSDEDGLCAEIEFRKHHFESMRKWPANDPRIKYYRYEDILGNELSVFEDMFKFYELPWITRKLGLHIAEKSSAKSLSKKTRHIRNAKPSQWKTYFTPKVIATFNQTYSDLLEQYNYPMD